MATALAASRTGTAHGPFIFFDLETTGLRPHGDHIIEIAGLRVVAGGGIAERFHQLIRIDVPVPRFITSITGITDDMLQDQEPIETTLPRFIDFVEDLPLVAYNVSFDMGFLGAAARRLRLRLGNAPVCALQVARRKLPDLANHKLATVARHLGVKRDQTHRALDDCEMGLRVFATLMRA